LSAVVSPAVVAIILNRRGGFCCGLCPNATPLTQQVERIFVEKTRSDSAGEKNQAVLKSLPLNRARLCSETRRLPIVGSSCCWSLPPQCWSRRWCSDHARRFNRRMAQIRTVGNQGEPLLISREEKHPSNLITSFKTDRRRDGRRCSFSLESNGVMDE